LINTVNKTLAANLFPDFVRKKVGRSFFVYEIERLFWQHKRAVTAFK
jgi:hypothetical protein